MRYRVLTLALATALGIAVACGGGHGSAPQQRIVLEPNPASTAQSANIDDAVAVLKRRLDAYGFGGTVDKSGTNQVVINLPASVNKDQALGELTPVGLLEFCEPVEDSSGNVAVLQSGTVQYQSQSCDPVRDVQGNVVANGGSITYVPWILGASADLNTRDRTVWQPAKGDLNGQPTALTSAFLKGDTLVRTSPISNQPLLFFSLNDDGAKLFGQITERLSQTKFPLAVFLDGEPIRGDNGHIIAPSVQSKITSQGEIMGLSLKEVQSLSKLLNVGPLPVPLRVVSTGTRTE